MVGLIALLALSGCLGGSSDKAAPDKEDLSKNLSATTIKALLPSGERGNIIEVNGSQVNITRMMKENLNNEMMVKGSKIDSIDIFKNVFKDPRVSSVLIVSIVKLTDSYGNTNNAIGSAYRMSRSTYQKINWDKFLFNNLDKVADGAYVNPVLLN